MTDIRKIIILGAGGHAKVLVDTLQHYDFEVVAIAAPHKSDSQALNRIKYLANDDEVLQHSATEVALVNAIGSTLDTKRRYETFHKFKIHGYHFVSLLHPSSNISQMDMEIAEGFQAMAGSIVNASVSIGENVLVNTQAVVEHGRSRQYSHWR